MTQSPKEPNSELIKQMLDNNILDWNRPSQLTTISADDNYAKLIPAIQALINKEVEAARIDEMHKAAESHRIAGGKGLPKGFQKRMNELQSELKAKSNGGDK